MGIDLIGVTDATGHILMVDGRTKIETISACMINNTSDQSLLEECSLADEERSEVNLPDEKRFIELKFLDGVEYQCSDGNEYKNDIKNVESENFANEDVNVLELIIVKEIKEIKNLAYHEELNALLDSDSDISTSISPLRSAYPTISNNPVDCSSAIFLSDLDLTNKSESSPVMNFKTDTEILCTVIPLQSSTSTGRFFEMACLPESTEDSFHNFLSFSESSGSGNETDIVMDELDGKTLLLNNSLIAVDNALTMNRTTDNSDRGNVMLQMTSAIPERKINYSMIQTDIQIEEKLMGGDTTILVRKRVEEYSERNEIVKKSKLEELKTSHRIDFLTTVDAVKNITRDDSMDVSPTGISSKENEFNFVDMNTQPQQTGSSEFSVAATVVHDIEIEQQHKQNMNDVDNEILVEATLESVKDRAIGRMIIRNEIAKWKYGWEIASFCAAQVARKKLAL